MNTRLTSRTERLMTIEQLLFRSVNGLRAVELAEVCGVDRRTVYRDLALLEEIGIPVSQNDGRFRLDQERYEATLRLGFDETMALLLAASALSSSSDVSNPHLSSAMMKLSRALPEALALHAAYLARLADQPGAATKVQVLETIARAWGTQEKVQIAYTSRDGTQARERVLSTYFVEPKSPGVLFVVGFDSVSQQVRAFKVSRIRTATPTGEHYELPSYVEIGRYLRRLRDDGASA